MNETESIFDFAGMDEDLDIAAIFKTSDSEEKPAPAEQPAPQNLAQTQQPTAQNKEDRSVVDLFPKAETKPAEKKTASSGQVSLFDKAPVFSYGGAKESITDTSMTFEELRIAKSDDFPELSEGKRVSWSVEYGKTSKQITDPKGMTIAGVKEEIEKSKVFLDGLQKSKDKNPDCLLKPRVTAQSKGIAGYKGVFASAEEAMGSDKAICLFPAKDGQVYELRKTEMGNFIAPKHNIVEFSEVRAGFFPALPLILRKLMGQLLSFFRCFMSEHTEFEALAHIYWDRKLEEYTVFIPRQTVSKAHIDADLRADALPDDRYLLYADVHSHNSMAAKFSSVDDADEQATRLYFVMGRLHRFYPSISARFSCGGVYYSIDPAQVIEGLGEEFPTAWLDNVTRKEALT